MPAQSRERGARPTTTRRTSERVARSKRPTVVIIRARYTNDGLESRRSPAGPSCCTRRNTSALRRLARVAASVRWLAQFYVNNLVSYTDIIVRDEAPTRLRAITQTRRARSSCCPVRKGYEAPEQLVPRSTTTIACRFDDRGRARRNAGRRRARVPHSAVGRRPRDQHRAARPSGSPRAARRAPAASRRAAVRATRSWRHPVH